MDGSGLPGPPVRPQFPTGSEAPPGLWDGLAEQVRAAGFTLHDAPDAEYLDGANGMTHWLKKTVHVRADTDPAARAKTLAHELGHIALHSMEDVDAVVHRGVAEVEAESFALMIAAAHGMNTDAYTIPYVATWASRVKGQDPVTTVQQTAARVRAAALQTLDHLQTPQTPDGAPPPAPAARPAPANDQPQRSTRRPGEGISL